MLKAATRYKRLLLVSCGLSLSLLTAGCATIDPEFRDPRDPFESYNRAMHRFNTEVDKAVLKPVARGYRAITPDPLDRGITNFFSNLEDVGSAINNLLQFKFGRALSDTGRVLANTTMGLLGFFDIASNMNLPKYGEDFGGEHASRSRPAGFWRRERLTPRAGASAGKPSLKTDRGATDIPTEHWPKRRWSRNLP